LVADGLGFMFQDRGELFSLKDGHPNIYAPGKRPFQTIIPGFTTKDGKPWMSFGVMGGDMQRRASRRSSSTAWIMDWIFRPRATVRVGTMKDRRKPWARICRAWGRLDSAAGVGRACGEPEGLDRAGLADGRVRRRVRALRVHRAPDQRPGPLVFGGQRDARGWLRAGLLAFTKYRAHGLRFRARMSATHFIPFP